NVAWIDDPRGTEREQSHEQTGDAADQAEQRRLREELPYQSLPPGPQRDADGDLLLSRGRTGEQETGDIRAGDQQHETHCAHDDQQRDAYVADHRLDERHDVDRERLVTIVLRTNTRGD